LRRSAETPPRQNFGATSPPVSPAHSDFKWFTSDLTPALSSKERENYIPPLENSRDWICRTPIRKTKTGQKLFLLLGEKARMRAGVKHQLHLPQSSIRSGIASRFENWILVGTTAGLIHHLNLT
jgi:hypothetical protein